MSDAGRVIVGVVDNWPSIYNAEKENIIRIFYSFNNYLSVDCYVVDAIGRVLLFPNESHLKYRKCGFVDSDLKFSFVINLHYEACNVISALCYCALWNPIAFYYGNTKSFMNVASFGHYISAGSVVVDSQISAWRSEAYLNDNIPKNYPLVNHTIDCIAETVINKNSKIFYCGINWYALGKTGDRHTRHKDVIDYLESKKCLNIYGPKLFHGVQVWKGYKSYVDEIDFDGGKSMIDMISKSGIALVFSHKSHISSEICSNRLFEAVAAGALVIADANPFIRDHFGDTVKYADIKIDGSPCEKSVYNIYRWAVNNPDEATAMAKKSQEIFKEKFLLRAQLSGLVKHYNDYVTQQKFDIPVHIVYFSSINDSTDTVEKVIDNIDSIKYPLIYLHILSKSSMLPCIEKAVSKVVYKNIKSVDIVRLDYDRIYDLSLHRIVKCLQNVDSGVLILQNTRVTFTPNFLNEIVTHTIENGYSVNSINTIIGDECSSLSIVQAIQHYGCLSAMSFDIGKIVNGQLAHIVCSHNIFYHTLYALNINVDDYRYSSYIIFNDKWFNDIDIYNSVKFYEQPRDAVNHHKATCQINYSYLDVLDSIALHRLAFLKTITKVFLPKAVVKLLQSILKFLRRRTS